MNTPFLNDKQSTQGIKKFIKPPTPAKVTGEQPKSRAGGAGTPGNRILPIRGQ